jgi:hypothetical protein
MTGDNHHYGHARAAWFQMKLSVSSGNSGQAVQFGLGYFPQLRLKPRLVLIAFEATGDGYEILRRAYSPSLKKNAGSMCSGLISLTRPTSCRKCGPRMHRQPIFGSLHAAGIRIGLRGLSFVTTV